MLKAFAEINEKGTRINVHFGYSPQAVKAIKAVPGRSFVGREKGGPFWTVPLDMESAKALRNEFGEGLSYGDALKSWGIQEKRRQRELRSLALADDAELSRVPALIPRLAAIIEGKPLDPSLADDELEFLPPTNALWEKRDARPYQRADIALMARENVLNANQPGTGKTLEYFGSVAEADLLSGIHLIVAPVTSHYDTWVREAMIYDIPGTILYGDTPDERHWAVAEAMKMNEAGEVPVWLVLGYDDIRLAKAKLDEDGKNIDPRPVLKRDHKGREYVLQREEFAPLYETEFNSFCIDESHKSGLPNNQSLFALGASLIKSKKKADMSGTPMGGKPIRLWGHLNWLDPDQYGSKWRWAEHWLEIDDNGFGKTIGGIKPGLEDDFYKAHAHRMVRREKREALPGLPVKVIKEIVCHMTPKQAKQYREFERESEIRIEEERLSATNVLSEYTRLKQFANAACSLERKKNGELRVVPQPESGKLQKLIETLDQHGIRKTDPEPNARALVGSESVEMIQMTAEFLRSQGIEVVELHGNVNPKEKKANLARFRKFDGPPVVLAMTVQTGGVSLNLQEADSVHALDEMWDPDPMEQFEDRADRGSRKKPLVCYYYRTEGTIQEYIQSVAGGKSVTNKNVLDIRRKMYKDNS